MALQITASSLQAGAPGGQSLSRFSSSTMASSHPCSASSLLTDTLHPNTLYSGHRTNPCTHFKAVPQSTMSTVVRFWGCGFGPPMRSGKQKARSSLDPFSNSNHGPFFSYHKPFLAGGIPSHHNTRITSNQTPSQQSNHTFDRHSCRRFVSRATSDGSDLSLQPPTFPSVSHDAASDSSRTLSSLLGAIFTVGDAPALAAEHAPATSGEPVHTAAWLLVVAVLAAVGWALRTRWESILKFLQSGVRTLGRSLLRTSEADDEHDVAFSTVEILGETYAIAKPVSLIMQLDEQDSRVSSRISERLEVYHFDDEGEGADAGATAWGPAWGPPRRRTSGSSSGPSESNSGLSKSNSEPSTNDFWASEKNPGSSRRSFGPMPDRASGLGRIVGEYTVSDEHGRSESSKVYENDAGDLVLETGESIVRGRSIGAGQRRIVEKATPELPAKQRERLIREVWEPGMKDGRLLARTLRAYDAMVRDRHVVSSAGHAVGGFFERASARVRNWTREQLFAARTARLAATDAFGGFRSADSPFGDPLPDDKPSMEELRRWRAVRWAMAHGEGKPEREKTARKRVERWAKNHEAAQILFGGGGDENGGGNFGNFGGRATAQDLASIIDAEKLAQAWGGVWEERVRTFAEDLTAEVVAPGDIDVSFESLPYPLDEGTRWALVSSAFLHLKRGQYASFVEGLPSLSPRVLLTGPPGSERYQEAVAKAMAWDCGARFLCFDNAQLWRVQEKFGLYDHLRYFSSASEGEGADSSGSERPVVISMGGAGPDMIKQFLQPLVEMNGKIGSPASLARLMSMEGKGGDSDAELATPPKEVDLPVMLGDRVKYKGNSDASPSRWDDISSGKQPRQHSIGRVTELTDSEVGVIFGESCWPAVIGKKREPDDVFYCKAKDLEVVSPHEDFTRMTLEALFQVVSSEAAKGPFVLFVRGLPGWMSDVPSNVRSDRFESLLAKLEGLDGNAIVVGSYAPPAPERKEKGDQRMPPGMDVMLESLMGQRRDGGGDKEPRVPPYLLQLFPSHVALKVPEDAALLGEWKRQMEADKRAMAAEANVHQLNKVLASSRLSCPDATDRLTYSQKILTAEQAQRVVAWAAAHVLTSDLAAQPVVADEKLVIPLASLEYALSVLDMVEKKKEDELAGAVADVSLDNEYEKSLMAEVIPPSEVGVKFDDIGALDPVKDTLRELVMLPLQRPELFKKGQLTKPAKGVLLFGPPGTGKTMLAKAVATEAGANFINVSLSSISSKWFGEAEKLVKAIFTLASKIAPTVIFIDEVDSLLGARGSGGEHEATRKMKNEFMSCWDGLRTKSTERVLVLAATNRPFDLDDAVIRRMPRRLMVDLPDAENRAKILNVILREEDLDADVDLNELAAQTEGYSGSDLKNLCVAAAYEPIRELLAQERKRQESARQAGGEAPGEAGPSEQGGAQPPLILPVIRPMRMADFKKAKETVGASVSPEASSINDLKKWNEEFGEGGNRKKRVLGFNLELDST